MKNAFLAIALLTFLPLLGQTNYWQQRIECKMEVELNDQNHRYSGSQKLVYYNNSPDTLHKVFYHLYNNAFQPGSMMDVRSQTIEDPDPRVGDRIGKLKEDEIGYLKINALSQNGKDVKYFENGTILEVDLAKPILPGKKAVFEMAFEGQVPLQIRRSGRDNKEGVDYSMTQWYPKMAEYDYMGWHADPYVGREFHGVLGDFEVSITIDSAYTIGATGVLQNPQEIGHGYANPSSVKENNSGKRTWKFEAEDVIDFAWAADKDFIHDKIEMENGPVLHFIYLDKDDIKENWKKLQDYTVQAFEYASEQLGKYPYPQYTVIQGGDGGMEYPMITLITGQRNLGSLVGVTVHEAVHSWYQAVLATNEGLYPWMDEGFTTFASSRIMSRLFNPEEDVRRGGYYDSYLNLVASGKEEPLSTMSDHYLTNYAYGAASYSKGAVFVAQLGYIIGEENLMNGMRSYFNTWKFKHPTPVNFIRVMEKQSGIHLKWYLNYMLGTLATIDYGIKRVEAKNDETVVLLERIGDFPMPIDLDITYTDGTRETVYIPLVIMRGAKNPETDIPFQVAPDWPWTNPTYELSIRKPISDIASITIDESGRLADVDRSNNSIDIGEKTKLIITN